ncbi:hypothetical protein NE237_011970 [Protea cynaroides]|uniref:PLAT domain-containing protein n=1 Tax=Protea cynaroides TaxID=273540 RepID=A0A9Q0JXK6_9MAGN|nr:hypothetical protein NE237_011970 [Protea cynaroides]
MEMTSRRFRSLIYFALFLSSAAAAQSDSEKCVYTLYVRTGSVIKSGTNSKISVELDDESGRSVKVEDLKEWGMMSSDYDYFERGNLDIFSGISPCVGFPVCRLNLTSDGSGQHHGWYCEYVEVTATAPHQKCSKTIFYVQQWLADDAAPYRLSAVRDVCGQQQMEKHGKTDQPLIVKRYQSHDNDHHNNCDHDNTTTTTRTTTMTIK